MEFILLAQAGLCNESIAQSKNLTGATGHALGTDASSTQELPDEILRAFRDWCASPEMQVMYASFLPLLNSN